MTAIEHGAAALERCCQGNAEAKSFLVLWSNYCHAIDDIVDGDAPSGGLTGAEALLHTYAMAIELYTHPFFLRNIGALRQVALNATSAYADSVAWEKSTLPWQRQYADVLRHSGSEMVLAVAQVCGGYRHMRDLALELRTLSYLQHHDGNGDAI